MKNLLTSLISLLALATFAQSTFVPQHQRYYSAPNTPRPSQLHQAQGGVFRSVCDSATMLDYNTYNQYTAYQQGLNFNGSWDTSNPTPYAQEITRYVNAIHGYDYSFAEGIWDSLAFYDYTSQSIFTYGLPNSTLYLDSLGMYLGISGPDTTATGMTHDSLVFYIYSVTAGTVSSNPVKSIVFSGHSGLDPFLQGPNFLGYAQIPIGQQFSQGQGFAIKMVYLAKDTATHLLLSYTYADSCGTVTYLGTQYSSPAYPSPFSGNTLWGEIIPNNTGNGATVTNENNQYAYSGDGFPVNCSYVYTQNWEFLPILRWGVPSITITPNANNICAGSTVKYTASVTEGGSTPSYQWEINGSYTGPDTSVFTYIGPSNGDVISCVLTSSDGCASSATAVSNAVTMVVNPAVTPSVSIAANSNSVCAGANVVFTATPANGGASPVYHWKLDGSNAGANTATYTDNSATNGDIITCTLISDANCAVHDTAYSNADTITIAAPVIPAISISASADTICAGTSVTFTATAGNGGPSPVYQWAVSGNHVGTNNSTYSSTALQNGNDVSCVLTSSAACATPNSVQSNTIEMTVNSVPVPGINVAGDVLTSTAVSGNQWFIDGAMIGGATGNTYTAGITGYYQVEASSNGCSSISDSVYVTVTGINGIAATSNIKVFPNPFSNNLIIQIGRETKDLSGWGVRITDALGGVVLTSNKIAYTNSIDLSDLANGVYFVTVAGGESNMTFRVVKQQ